MWAGILCICKKNDPVVWMWKVLNSKGLCNYHSFSKRVVTGRKGVTGEVQKDLEERKVADDVAVTMAVRTHWNLSQDRRLMKETQRLHELAIPQISKKT